MIFKFLKGFIEVIQGVRIVLSPTLIAVLVALLVFQQLPNSKGFMAGIVIILIGLIIGIVWAVRIWKKTGTNEYMSRVNASPDFDKIKKNE